ncbi:hypothetical protein [Bdellovibrio sp. HCB2-146]|uniref:hypothetical protein n=1 Tax=Bdellovibrio sp. HCB2-146 TaxID=3394362 RepID=UPI0039BD8542
MKNILFIAAVFLVAGCSSQPTQPTQASDAYTGSESDISGQKAAPAHGEPSTTVYTEPGKSPSLEIAPAKTTSGSRNCETPLGTIPDGGSLTGYMKATVPYPDVCISDTITCKNGKWSGQAIHKECKIIKKK